MNEILEKNEIIIDTNRFKEFLKILSILKKSTGILIEDSKINQRYQTSILYVNMEGILGNKLTLHINNPDKRIDFFKKLCEKGDGITIREEDEYSRYILTNGVYSLILPKEHDDLYDKTIPPNLNSAKKIGDSIIIKKKDPDPKNANASDIKFFTNKSGDFVNILIKNDQMCGINIPNTGNIKFPGYQDIVVDEINNDYMLKSYSFLSIDGESYRILLTEVDGTFWLITKIDTGFIDLNGKGVFITLYEDLSISYNEDNIL